MPAIPTSWSNAQFSNTTFAGMRGDTQITQLESGYVLVVWLETGSALGTAGQPPAGDIIGRIFDPLGSPVTGEIRFNTIYSDANEILPSITATADGGFAVAYVERDGAEDAIVVEKYDFNPDTAAVSYFVANWVHLDAPNVTPGFVEIASSNATSILSVYELSYADGSNSIFVRHYNPTTNVMSAPVALLVGGAGAGDLIGGLDIDVLTNGNYVITYSNRNNGDDRIEVAIYSSTGAFISGGATADASGESYDPQVVALTGGGFAVTWMDGAEIAIRTYYANGTTNQPQYLAVNNNNNVNEPAIAAIGNNQFVVLWDDDTLGQIRGSRFAVNPTTGAVTSIALDFLVFGGGFNPYDIEVEGFEDGRFGVSWTDGERIYSKIMDPRDGANSPSVDSPDGLQIGTVGNDTFLASFFATYVHGWNGDDRITANGVIKEYFGGNGNDTIFVTSAINNDYYSGGGGTDTIDWSGAPINGGIFNLEAGTAVFAGVETMVGFENLNGTQNKDTIVGSGFANILNGNGGDDHIKGGAGDDTLNGGEGNDTLVGEIGSDIITGGVGNDYLSGQDGNDTMDGNAGNDQMFGGNGVDTMNGGSGADTIRGNAGNDIINGSIGTDTIFGGGDRDIISGGDQADNIYGQAGDDNLGTGLSGNGGNDMINGSGGNDLLNGHDGQDRLYGSSGNDVLNGGNGNDFMHGGTGNDTLNGQGHDDTMYGYHGADRLNGGDGSDRLNGGDGHDTLRGGAGNDILTGGRHNDDLWGDAGSDRFNFDDGWGNDTIHDFANNGIEKINLSAVTGINGIGNLTITNSGGGALISFGVNSIHVLGVTAAQLDSSDFIF